jgi:hypothetical protein
MTPVYLRAYASATGGRPVSLAALDAPQLPPEGLLAPQRVTAGRPPCAAAASAGGSLQPSVSLLHATEVIVEPSLLGRAWRREGLTGLAVGPRNRPGRRGLAGRAARRAQPLPRRDSANPQALDGRAHLLCIRRTVEPVDPTR